MHKNFYKSENTQYTNLLWRVYGAKVGRLFQSLIGITFLLFISFHTNAQVIDSLVKDTSSSSKVVFKKNTKPHYPKRAALLSAAVPGLGQAYNKKYWKIPVIYLGLGALGYSINANHQKYTTYRNAYRDRIDNDPNTIDDYSGIYSNDQLTTLYQYYHRYRDLSAIGFAAVYLLNIVDAAVDAHLFTFDVSDDLSFNVQPTFINTAGRNKYTSGISLNLNF